MGRTQEIQPVKWRKYLKLVEFDLVDLEGLNKQISRFSKDQSAELKCQIAHQFADARRLNLRLLLVIKLIPLSIGFKLPNLRIHSDEEFEKIDHFLHEHQGFNFQEMWCCGTPVDEQGFSVAGRILFFQDLSSFGQLVEQVWRCSPRLLEDFSSKFPYPYCRAWRPDWGFRYELKEIHDISGTPKEQLEQEFLYAMGIIERNREKLQTFTDFLERFEFRAFNIEYKVLGNKLIVIDWDTPDDLLALRELNA